MIRGGSDHRTAALISDAQIRDPSIERPGRVLCHKAKGRYQKVWLSGSTGQPGDESFAGRLGRMGDPSRREVPRTHSEELIQVNHAAALQVYSAAL
jgi:hypothetical protein